MHSDTNWMYVIDVTTRATQQLQEMNNYTNRIIVADDETPKEERLFIEDNLIKSSSLSMG